MEGQSPGLGCEGSEATTIVIIILVFLLLGAGPWWGSTPLFPIEPTNIGQPNQQDQPVMAIIRQFIPFPTLTLQLVNQGQLQFTAPPGFVYQPQASPDLTPGSWTDFGSAVTGSNQTVTVTLPIGAGSQEFYRVLMDHAP